jgi:hypothetical protein
LQRHRQIDPSARQGAAFLLDLRAVAGSEAFTPVLVAAREEARRE